MLTQLFYTAQDHQPKEGAFPSRLGPTISCQDNPPQTGPHTNLIRIISQLRFSSQVTVDCIKLKLTGQDARKSFLTCALRPRILRADSESQVLLTLSGSQEVRSTGLGRLELASIISSFIRFVSKYCFKMESPDRSRQILKCVSEVL